MSVCCECCQVEVSAKGRSLVQRSPADCGLSLLYYLGTSGMRQPWPALGCCTREKYQKVCGRKPSGANLIFCSDICDEWTEENH